MLEAVVLLSCCPPACDSECDTVFLQCMTMTFTVLKLLFPSFCLFQSGIIMSSEKSGSW